MIGIGNGRRASAALAAVLLLTVGLAPTATAQTAAFGMSKTSVRAGEATVVSEIDPCPASANNTQNSVEVVFTDSLGGVSTGSASFDVNGHWSRAIYLVPAHKRVLAYSPVAQYSNEAAPGAGTIEVKCTKAGTTTLEYSPRTLTISGPGASVKLPNLTAEQPARIKSGVHCPVGSGSVGIRLAHVESSTSYHYQATPDANGAWTLDFTVPEKFPRGFGLVTMNCHPPGNHGGQRTFAYAETFGKVTNNNIFTVAMGDSYSSGEGVVPFEPGTSGEGGCHRSVDAYPRVLEEDFSPEMKLDNNFVACSGATTADITLDGTNPAQMDVLRPYTDFVTMTIGGNNMPFVEFAEACAMWLQDYACTIGGSATNNAIAGIVNNVIPSVQSMLETVRDRLIMLGNADATVVVLGYPQIVPPTFINNGSDCGWLQSDETAAIRHVVTQLNTAIKNEVDAIGYDFHHVSATEIGSPFIGHELCRSVADTNTTPNYFNNVDIFGHRVYTFHPNQAGQEAYATLVKGWLAANPQS